MDGNNKNAQKEGEITTSELKKALEEAKQTTANPQDEETPRDAATTTRGIAAIRNQARKSIENVQQAGSQMRNIGNDILNSLGFLGFGPNARPTRQTPAKMPTVQDILSPQKEQQQPPRDENTSACQSCGATLAVDQNGKPFCPNHDCEKYRE